MKWFKRCWLSIIRRPMKSLLLLLVVFVMSNLLAGSLSIIYTSEEIKENIKESTSPTVNLIYEDSYIENEVFKTRSLSLNELNQYVSVTDEMSVKEEVLSVENHYSIDINAMYKDLGWQESDERELNLKLYGTDVIENQYFKVGDHTLTSVQKNRFLSRDELNSDEVNLIVDIDFAYVYDFGGAIVPTGLCDIGNEVTLTLKSKSTYFDEDTGTEKPYEYKFKANIVGVFINKSNEPYKNVVYASNDALFKVMEDANQYFESVSAEKAVLSLESTSLYMKTIDGVKDFEDTSGELLKQLPKGIYYESATKIYDKNVGPIQNLDTIARIIFIVSVFSTIIVLGLVIVFFISERKTEMGIYSSLGEKRRNMISQVLLEILLISTLAISMASISGIFLGNKLSDYMLEVQRYIQREYVLGSAAKLEPIYKPVEGAISLKTRDDVIDNYEIKPDVKYFAIIYAVCEMGVIVSCAVPMWYLSSLKPKEIML